MQSQIIYCQNRKCSDYQSAKYMQIVMPPYIPELMINELLRCEECGEPLKRIQDIEMPESELFF